MIKDCGSAKRNRMSKRQKNLQTGPGHENENVVFIIVLVQSGGNGIQGKMRSLI